MHILRRQWNRECPTGSGSFYQCAANGFQGCCRVDPCALSGCPDSSILPTRSSATATTATDGVPKPTSPVQQPPTTSTSDAIVHTITSLDGDRTVFVTTTVLSAPTAQPSISTSAAANSKTDISRLAGTIAGSVVGGVAILALALFLLYRCHQKRRARQRKEATLPPPYSSADMSEQLGGANAPGAETEKADLQRIANIEGDPDPDPVPNLDSAMVRPTIELGEGPLGCIPELAANSRTALNTPLPPSPVVKDSKTNRRNPSGRDHVMSWTQLNSESNRSATSRLSQPHNVPDHSVAVWENMSAPKETNSNDI